MNTEFARRQMIQQQARAWDVLDENVLQVLDEVPREQFVPAGYASLAFADTEIPLGHGQMMLTPTITGRVLQALGLAGGESVLEVGTGSGFLTACLATLSSHVTSIDIYDDFLQGAETNLAACDIDNVDLLNMNAMRDLPDEKFDAIAITGSIESFDPRFVGALNPGGRLFVVVGTAPVMSAKLAVRTEEKNWHSTTQFETEIGALVDGALPPQFSF